MIRIAIVDDEPIALESIVTRFEKLQDKLEVKYKIDTYTSGNQLMTALQKNQYQALFLDIDMPKHSGFDISAVLREKNMDTPIVFITNRDDLMQQAFQYKVLGFVRKAHIDTELEFALECVLKEIRKTVQTVQLHKNNKTTVEMLVSEIIYIESLNHTTTVYLVNHDPVVTREPLSSYISQDAFHGFIQISSSCIVNHTQIFSIEKDNVILKNRKVLYISRRRQKTVKEHFLRLSRRTIL